MANNRWSKSKMSKALEPIEEDKQAKRKAMDELELKKLKREARMMKEVKIKDVVKERQTKVKHILEKEKDNLEGDLKLTKATTRCIQDYKQTQDIANLFAQGDDLDEAISLEKKYIADLESEIQKETKNIQSLNKSRGKTIINSDYLLDKERERADRTLESYKSQIAIENKQLATTVKENEEMRKKLDNLLRQKAQFNQIYEQLMGKLTQSKTLLKGIVEQSRQKFQKRDEVVRKIEALRRRDKEDCAKQMDEMQNLEIKYYEDTKMADFRHRVLLIRENLEEKKRPNIESVELRKLEAVLERAKELMKKVKDLTGGDNSEEICDYIIKEDANLFALFNFNNEVRDQLEVVMQDNVEKLRTVNEESAVAETKIEEEYKYKELMKRKLHALEQENSDLADLLDANSKIFSRLLDRIKTLFEAMNCNSSPIQELLGNNGEVTEFNNKLYLNLIETKVTDALDLVHQTTTNRFRVMGSPSLLTKSSSKSLKSSKSIKSSKSTRSRADCQLPKIVSKKIVTKTCGECDRSYRPFMGIW